jgi:Colicin V production protein
LLASAMLAFVFAIQNTPSDPGPAAGSPLWQVVFMSFAVILVLFEVLRGWRRGIARQLARLGALIAAYFAAFYAGRIVMPLLRPVLKMPDVVLSILAGGVLALLVYAIISGLGTILFKRTSQHDSAFVRLLYGLTGAIFGLFFGAFLVWLLVFGVRSLGAVADAKVRQDAANQTNAVVHAVDRRHAPAEQNDESATLMTSLARLKNSLELGAVGDAVRKADVIPTETYEKLGKLGKVASDPERAHRFLSFPGAHELSEHPKIVALKDDPEIADMISQGRYIDLLQNQKILDAANDPELRSAVMKFDLDAALDFALEQK